MGFLLHLAEHFFNEVLILLLAYLLCRYAQVSSEIIIVVIFFTYMYLVEVLPCLMFLGVGSQEADSLFDVASFILKNILCSHITHF